MTKTHKRTNSDRAVDGERALNAHLGNCRRDPDPTDDLIDMLTNVFHFAVQRDIDIDEIINDAKTHLNTEIAEEAGQ